MSADPKYDAFITTTFASINAEVHRMRHGRAEAREHVPDGWTPVDSPDTVKVWRSADWGVPSGFVEKRKQTQWAWGPSSKGTTWVAVEFEHDGGRRCVRELPTEREAKWWAEHCDKNPGAHSNSAIHSLMAARLKWAYEDAGEKP